MSYQLLLTTLGKQKIAAAATDAGSPVRIAQFALGQGINVDFSKRLDEQVLVSKRYQANVASVSAVQDNQYEIDCIVPADIGGWAIREIGLIDSDGVMIWVGQLPEVQKPDAGDTAAVDYRIRVIVKINNPLVQLVVDTNIITATKAWVQERFTPLSHLTDQDPHPQYVNSDRLQKIMQYLYKIGYLYWSDSNVDPKPFFDELTGEDTYWRRLEGVTLVAVKDDDSQIDKPWRYVGVPGDVSPNTSRPHHYPLYTKYLWERYDPDAIVDIPVRYDGLTKADGTAKYQ